MDHQAAVTGSYSSVSIAVSTFSENKFTSYIYIYISRILGEVRGLKLIQNVPGGKVNILGSHSIGHSKQKVYMYTCPIPNSFRDRAVSLCRRATRHVLTRVAECIDVDRGIFGNVLY
jgi:hypothetical protein